MMMMDRRIRKKRKEEKRLIHFVSVTHTQQNKQTNRGITAICWQLKKSETSRHTELTTLNCNRRILPLAEEEERQRRQNRVAFANESLSSAKKARMRAEVIFLALVVVVTNSGFRDSPL